MVQIVMRVYKVEYSSFLQTIGLIVEVDLLALVMKFNSFLNFTKSRANGRNIVSRTSGERQTQTADLQTCR